MPTLAALVASYTRTPSATCYLDGQRWYDAKKFTAHQKFKEQIESGSVEGRNPPVTPRIGMSVRWTWGYNGVEVAGFTGYVSDTDVASYPNTDRLTCSGVLWLADQNNEVLQTSPLNSIKASDAARYLLNNYGNIPLSRMSLPAIPASGAAWAGSEWTLGILTPVQWGDTDTQSGGTTAMKAAAEIYGCMGFWLYATPDGKVTAKQMERRPSATAREVFEVDVNFLLKSPPHRQANYANVYNQVTVRGANTGVDGAQLYDQRRTTSPVLKAGVYKDLPYSSFLLEYENEADAGLACVSKVTERILNVVSRIPDTIPPFTVKADPNRRVGDTAGVINTALRLAAQKNYFIYEITRTLDLDTGLFDDQLSLDGGTGNIGFTTIPPPDASFSWRLMAETVDGAAVVEVELDGSASTSPSGEIVSWAFSTSTPTYGSSPSSFSGVRGTLIFLASDSPAAITLTVTDTTSKTDALTVSVDLTGADTTPPFQEALHGAAGAAWYATPDGGANWRTQAGDSISVDTIGAGADDRAPGTAGTYGIVSTRGSGGAAGLRGSLDLLATTPTSLIANSGAVTSNIWRNEAQPNRLWWAVGTAVYRSLDNGATKTAMHVAPATVTWIMEDPAVDNSVFLLAGADMLNATDPTLGWALLYAGPVGATARQFVRSRDGQVTWIGYTGAPSGEALQRVETGALADFSATDVRSLALDRNASSLIAAVYAVTGDDPAQIWTFDGLTGLSAVQSSQFFPSGATVQHMLSSRQFNVIYTADFDSIAAGQGAFRKYFPLADQLLLWKALASGEQGHMLGLAARASAPAELLRMTIAVDPGGVWHWRDDDWKFRPLPFSGSVFGVAIVADPFNPDRWMAIFNDVGQECAASGGVIRGGGSWSHSPLWYTEDAGVTWTEVVIATPSGWVDGSTFHGIAWSDLTGNQWCATFGDPGSFHSVILRGTGSTVTAGYTSTAYLLQVTGGADGDFLLASNFTYLDTGGTLTMPPGTQPPIATGDKMPNSRRTYYPDGTNMFTAADYRAAQPVLLFASLGITAISVGHNALYYTNNADTFRVVDPLGANVSTKIENGQTKSFPRVDRQTRTIGAVAIGGAVLVDNGVTTTMIPPPADEGFLSNINSSGERAFEVMVRGT